MHYTSPDATQELVGKSSIARGDLMETWQKSEQNAHQGQDYQKIRLEKTTFRGNPAVVWEYTFTLKGVPWHARLLGFDQEGKSYQINTWYQPEIETAGPQDLRQGQGQLHSAVNAREGPAAVTASPSCGRRRPNRRRPTDVSGS